MSLFTSTIQTKWDAKLHQQLEGATCMHDLGVSTTCMWPKCKQAACTSCSKHGKQIWLLGQCLVATRASSRTSRARPLADWLQRHIADSTNNDARPARRPQLCVPIRLETSRRRLKLVGIINSDQSNSATLRKSHSPTPTHPPPLKIHWFISWWRRVYPPVFTRTLLKLCMRHACAMRVNFHARGESKFKIASSGLSKFKISPRLSCLRLVDQARSKQYARVNEASRIKTLCSKYTWRHMRAPLTSGRIDTTKTTSTTRPWYPWLLQLCKDTRRSADNSS